ncbi:uncharacterized protein BJ171DRAFT_535817, partial [Polychytrium aggregatum]|uniref:uncharacterized protein n=1 Tax=Polychytrium aggregatum TaxID=110093 RepID=UPI0022FE1B4F
MVFPPPAGDRGAIAGLDSLRHIALNPSMRGQLARLDAKPLSPAKRRPDCRCNPICHVSHPTPSHPHKSRRWLPEDSSIARLLVPAHSFASSCSTMPPSADPAKPKGCYIRTNIKAPNNTTDLWFLELELIRGGRYKCRDLFGESFQEYGLRNPKDVSVYCRAADKIDEFLFELKAATLNADCSYRADAIKLLSKFDLETHQRREIPPYGSFRYVPSPDIALFQRVFYKHKDKPVPAPSHQKLGFYNLGKDGVYTKMARFVPDGFGLERIPKKPSDENGMVVLQGHFSQL